MVAGLIATEVLLIMTGLIIAFLCMGAGVVVWLRRRQIRRAAAQKPEA